MGGVTFAGENRAFRVQSFDAGSVAPGFNTNTWDFRVYDKMPPQAADGAAFCLLSNLYAVNYPMWYPWRPEDAHSRFRFAVQLD